MILKIDFQKGSHIRAAFHCRMNILSGEYICPT